MKTCYAPYRKFVKKPFFLNVEMKNLLFLFCKRSRPYDSDSILGKKSSEKPNAFKSQQEIHITYGERQKKKNRANT